MFSFTAPVTCVDVNVTAHTAKFGYTAPNGPGQLPGYPVAVKVFDGGTPGTLDTFEHREAVDSGPVGSCLPQTVEYYPAYPIQTGNLVVHAA